MSANQGQIVGLELKHRHFERWALIAPDASEPGRFRHQAFDRRGFFRHAPCETAEQALEGAVRDGFEIPDPGALVRLSEELEWLEGLVDRRHQQAVETGSEVEA